MAPILHICTASPHSPASSAASDSASDDSAQSPTLKRFPCKFTGCEKDFSTSQHSKSHHRRLNLKLMREREAIACTVLTSGVSHAALESRFPFSNLFVDNTLPQQQQPQGCRSTFVIPSSSISSNSSGSNFTGNACKTSIKFLCE
ncbi:hypothetical protein CcCBS67573_g08636 [Chytriomyces confervae]|uniref:Uncharacterized protein n=1 Tax=Chytriomyces confervae TaxID=246404 RepID=A0A507EIH7_9FUNG|nr:hypothetical protein CcCBS67573_g08636 [Chytriomyces confervae]